MEGKAEVVISLDDWKEGNVGSTTHEIIVAAPKKGAKMEPVTKRLIKTIPHPDRRATVRDVRFSPDGSRMLMAGYPSGIVQILDTKTWKETARVDAAAGRRSSWMYANPTPDWTTLLVDNRTRKVIKEEKDGKVKERLQVDGQINRYELTTGKLRDSIRFTDRGPTQVFVSPDGKSAIVNVERSFEATDRERPAYCEIVDLKTKAIRKLFDSQSYCGFTADGKTAYFSSMTFQRDGKVISTLSRYDLVAGKIVQTIKSPNDQTFFDGADPTPDGKFVVTSHRCLKPTSAHLVILSADTLDEVARIHGTKEAERNNMFESPLFTPDGKTMITRSGGPVLIYDMETKKVAREVNVSELLFPRMTLSQDGKRLVIASLPKFDYKFMTRDPDPYDLPQPRALIVELDNPKSEPEVLILPHGAVGGMAFARDGNTVAIGSTGGVHVLDVTR